MKTLRFATLLLASISLSVGALAQLDPDWFVPAFGSQISLRMALDGGGRIATGGTVLSQSSSDLVVSVHEADGSFAWNRILNASPADEFHDLAFAPNGDLYVLGTAIPTGADPIGVLARYDATGLFLWATGLPADFVARRLAIAPDSHIVVAGWSSPSSGQDLRVLRYAPAGFLVHQVTAVAPGAEFLHDLAIAADGAAVVAGESYAPIGSDSVVARFAADGSSSWLRTLVGPGTGYEQASAVVVDPAGRVYAGGFRRLVANGAEGYVWKLDAAGNTQWIDANPEPGSWTIDLALDPRGDVLAIARGSGTTNEPYHLRKLDDAGSLLWARTRADAPALGFLLDAGGEPLVFGTEYGLAFGQAFLTRYDRDGLERWTKVHPIPGPSTRGFAAGLRAPGEDFYLLEVGNTFASVGRWSPTVTQFCFGDGTGAACPCANASAIGDREGCLSTLGVGGRLIDSGVASVAADTLRLHAGGVTNSHVTFFQGTSEAGGGAGVPFGDGLRCLAGTQLRIGTRLASSNAYAYPSGADTSIAAQGLVTTPGTRYYQVLFRNSAAFCTSATFNLTNGLRVVWAP